MTAETSPSGPSPAGASPEPSAPAAPGARGRRWAVWAAAGVIVAAGAGVYLNSFAGVFVLDDHYAIVRNGRIRSLWPVADTLRVLKSPRPVLDLSLAVNYALGGLDVRGYHAFNLAVHLAAALALFGVVRRTLLTERLAPAGQAGRFGRASAPLALAVAVIWAVHPLHTGAVTYTIQRAESMMGMFYLLALYCAIRGHAAPGRGWYAAAIVASALGMATKQVMVTAPLVILLHDRVFVGRSFRAIFRRRWPLYAALAGTWAVLAVLVWTMPPAATAGFEVANWTPWSYLATQFGVILHYLRLSVWPAGQCLDYAWRPARAVGEVLPQAIAVAVLLAATGLALWRRPTAGFAGAWFFLILAPTSSVMPIMDAAFEHRMYLSLAAPVVLFVLGGYALARRVGLAPGVRRALLAGLAAAAAVALGALTVRRNQCYHDDVGMYRDVVAKAPHNARGHRNLGVALCERGQVREAVGHLREALAIKPDSPHAHNNYGVALERLGRIDQAIAEYETAIELDGDLADAHGNLGAALTAKGQYARALDHFRTAIELTPFDCGLYLGVGVILAQTGNSEKALEYFRQARDRDPGYAKAYYNMGIVYARAGDLDEALRHFGKAVELNGGYAEARCNLALALILSGRPREALPHYRAAIRADPGNVRTMNALARLLATCPDAEVRDGARAVKLARQACQAGGGEDACLLDTLAAAHAEAGQFDEAAAAARRAIQRAREAGQERRVEGLTQRLGLYRSSRPLRETPEQFQASLP